MSDCVRQRPVAGVWRILAFAATVAMTSTLEACGGGSATSPTFDLSVAAAPSERPLRADLIIREPLSPLELDSPRILVRSGPKSLAYFADAQWSDRVPVLVQTRLAQTLEQAKLFRTVSRETPNRPATYTLELEIRHFELDAPSGEAVVEIAAKIAARGNEQIVATRDFKKTIKAAGVTGPQAAAALDKAFSAVMADMVAFMPRRL